MVKTICFLWYINTLLFSLQRIGTAHGEELPYMFGAPMVTDGMNHFSRNFTKAEALLSDAMILFLGNFARTG